MCVCVCVCVCVLALWLKMCPLLETTQWFAERNVYFVFLDRVFLLMSGKSIWSVLQINSEVSVLMFLSGCYLWITRVGEGPTEVILYYPIWPSPDLLVPLVSSFMKLNAARLDARIFTIILSPQWLFPLLIWSNLLCLINLGLQSTLSDSNVASAFNLHSLLFASVCPLTLLTSTPGLSRVFTLTRALPPLFPPQIRKLRFLFRPLLWCVFKCLCLTDEASPLAQTHFPAPHQGMVLQKYMQFRELSCLVCPLEMSVMSGRKSKVIRENGEKYPVNPEWHACWSSGSWLPSEEFPVREKEGSALNCVMLPAFTQGRV
jgi:hypothetical protein